jgi:recombinational DNA repair ATPase RecF
MSNKKSIADAYVEGYSKALAGTNCSINEKEVDFIRHLEKELYDAKEESPSKALEVVKGINDMVQERVQNFALKYEKQIEAKYKADYDVLKAKDDTEMLKKEQALLVKEKEASDIVEKYNTKFIEVRNEVQKTYQEKEDTLIEEIKTLKAQLKEDRTKYLLSVIAKVENLGTYYASNMSVKVKGDWFYRTVEMADYNISRAFREILVEQDIIQR